MINASKLRMHMYNKGLSVTQLAKLTGISRKTLYKMLGGKSKYPLPKHIEKIASSLGVEILDILNSLPVEHDPCQVSNNDIMAYLKSICCDLHLVRLDVDAILDYCEQYDDDKKEGESNG